MSRAQAAALVGVSERTWQTWETSSRRRITDGRLSLWCHRAGVDFADFVRAEKRLPDPALPDRVASPAKLARRLRAFRHRHGLTQPQAAAIMGVCTTTVVRYEQGRTHCAVYRLHRLCDRVGADRGELA